MADATCPVMKESPVIQEDETCPVKDVKKVPYDWWKFTLYNMIQLKMHGWNYFKNSMDAHGSRYSGGFWGGPTRPWPRASRYIRFQGASHLGPKKFIVVCDLSVRLI